MNICVCLSQLFKNDIKKETIYDKVKDYQCKYPMIVHFINFKKKNTCIICLESLNNKKTVITRCNHKFHLKCINSWCNINDSCPLCRYKYPTG
uniref:RING-type domain-containing protein n=1 Tax=viral metagenome TaxID=1070528 RepID=A0A6C0LFM5_9ZZZZ